MPKKTSAADAAPTDLLLVRSATAAKLGPRSTGRLTYGVLRDTDGTAAYLAILANETGGMFSREPVSLGTIEGCLLGARDGKTTFAAKRLTGAFRGRSANNRTFLCAALVAEQLVSPAEGKSNQYVTSGSWKDWKDAVLALPGTPFVFETDSKNIVGDTGADGVGRVGASLPDTDAALPADTPEPAPKTRRGKRKTQAEETVDHADPA